ncbi:MAG: hypothetical protein WA842_01280 [Croceibacterium sp.]
MNEVQMAENPAETVEDVLRNELAQGDAVIATARPILHHLLAHDDHSMFNDEVVARVRGMMHDIAFQLLFATAEAAGLRDRTQLLEEQRDELAGALFADTDFLAHAHALTLEAQLTERLQRRSGVDGVLSSLLQEQTASSDPGTAGLAMMVIASQARFMQRFRRMELPLAELPGDLFHRALLALADHAGDHAEAAAKAANALRANYVEGEGRLGLTGRLVASLGSRAMKALAIDHSGVAIFTTALAMASRQDRDLTILSLGDRQFARLALALCAAGLTQPEVEAQFLYLHPDIALPEGFEALTADRAAALLAGSSRAFAG